jgi:hypothetical protein
VFVVPACASSGSSPTTDQSPSSLTAAQYRQRANTICANLYTAQPPKTTPPKLLEWVVGQGRHALAGIKALNPPAALAKAHEQLVALDTREVAVAASVASRLKTGQLTLAQAGRAIQRLPAGKEVALWKEMGVKVCAESPSAYLSQHPG